MSGVSTGLDKALYLCGDRGLGLHVFYRGGELGQILQLRIGPKVAGNVLLCRGRHAQRAKAVVAREEQHFQNGQAGRPVNVANNALAPAVGAGVVNCAGGRVPLASAEDLPLDDGHVLAERKVPPVLCVGKSGAVCHQLREAELAHQCGRRRVDHGPHIELVLRHVGAWRDGLGHFFLGSVLARRAARPSEFLLAALSICPVGEL